MTYLACYASLCENYLGVWPNLELFVRLFFVKAGTEVTQGPLVKCGCAIIVARGGTFLPKPILVDSAKMWQKSYFYVEDLEGGDRIGLAPFTNVPPVS